MAAFVALFRAVNVGGSGVVAMRDVHAMAVRLGRSNPRTLLQSGNLIFSAATTAGALEGRLENAATADLGLDTRVLVRSAADWAALVAACPFPEVARVDPSRLLAMPLRDSPSGAAEAALRDAIRGGEAFALRGAIAYIHYPDGIGRSRLTTALIERRLGTIGTARNWTSVLRIAAALAA